jgi:hypothetical protein
MMELVATEGANIAIDKQIVQIATNAQKSIQSVQQDEWKKYEKNERRHK